MIYVLNKIPRTLVLNAMLGIYQLLRLLVLCRAGTKMEADSAGPDRPFVCQYCPKKYLRKNNLEDHVLMEHPDTEQVNALNPLLPRNIEFTDVLELPN